MTLNITSKQMDITPAIRAHVEDRLAKLEKWQTQLINPHFILNKTPKGFSVEASIGTPTAICLPVQNRKICIKPLTMWKKKLERQLNKLQHKSESRRANERLKDSFKD